MSAPGALSTDNAVDFGEILRFLKKKKGGDLYLPVAFPDLLTFFPPAIHISRA